ncbi:hypothetical protein B4Q04_19735 [Zobellia sp. OII3]|uniref:arylsulfatase B n=1 Tax=Zobellia sp. OII3 TaxID=2034520 RepID=UPI000B52E5D3|nr:arylsulfatase [Zobellia sp. OII3]OWW23564.1 hypothetical protein B4Q04_19735 [Zobellia sp. OII3]
MKNLICICGFAIFSTIGSAQQKPNIVFIVADDMGWADIGYHNSEIRSPNLDKLAKTGVELDYHYVQPQCTPTRVALMTGQYPTRISAKNAQAHNEETYPIGTQIMPHMFKDMGYTTAIMGKWHMGCLEQWGPKHHGFDYSYGSYAGAVGMYDHRYTLTKKPYSITWHRNHELVEEEGHVTDLVRKEAVEYIHKNKDKPFFLYLPFHAVHVPLVEKDPKWNEMNKHIQWDDRRLMASAVSHLDDAVGQVVQALDDAGIRENTVIIFTSDNGAWRIHKGDIYPAPDPALSRFSFNHPMRGWKIDIYEGGMRVPAFVNWPAKLKPYKLKTPMHVIDWMPTLADLLDYKGEDKYNWEGVDMWKSIESQYEVDDKREFYFVWGENRTWEGLRYGDWKIVRKKNNGVYSKWELFNLENDPYEAQNLASSESLKLNDLVLRFDKQKQNDKL